MKKWIIITSILLLLAIGIFLISGTITGNSVIYIEQPPIRIFP